VAAKAKDYIGVAIGAADDLQVGQGHGPVHHFHALWRD
jgi:hydroxymethylpyrimidine/phosphomethylpyrimidine kinase